MLIVLGIVFLYFILVGVILSILTEKTKLSTDDAMLYSFFWPFMLIVWLVMGLVILGAVLMDTVFDVRDWITGLFNRLLRRK